jgi:hypothetical protein
MRAIRSLVETLTTSLWVFFYCPPTVVRQRICAHEKWGDLAMLGKLSTLFLAILFSAPWAIGRSTFGDILGVVKDPSQGTVLAAQVVLTRVEDKSEHSATTDADGAFHFVNLRPGHYDLLISASGFAEFKISSAQLDAVKRFASTYPSNWLPRRKRSRSGVSPVRLSIPRMLRSETQKSFQQITID